MSIGLIPTQDKNNSNKEVVTKEINSKLARKSLIDNKCIEALQFRNHEEEKSARLYEDMYMYLDNVGYTNAGALWHKYAHEEASHADWAREYLLSLGIQPELRPMPLLKGEYTGLAEVIKISYEHEIEITKQCNELASIADEAGDHMLHDLAHRYLREQIEEVSKMQTWMDKLETFGEDKMAMRFLEMEIGEMIK